MRIIRLHNVRICYASYNIVKCVRVCVYDCISHICDCRTLNSRHLNN